MLRSFAARFALKRQMLSVAESFFFGLRNKKNLCYYHYASVLTRLPFRHWFEK